MISDSDIGVIGLACRFPGASSVEMFWQNLCAGIESIDFFSDAELLAAGVDPVLLANSNYVKAGTVLPDIEKFDAAFFGFTPREAETMDPQQRLFLECAQEVLEHAGYNPDTYRGAIGVFAGAGISSYLLYNIYPNGKLAKALGDYHLVLANDKDFLATRVSYKLNLRGPSLSVQTACSTSLVAIHLACHHLLNGECDIALAGGVSAPVLTKSGYLYQDGMIFSPDGHCRAFDAKAQGIVGGSGSGIIALKRLEEALEDGDTVHAVIKGSAINNDGALKVGYTAPSVEGQAQVIREAQAVAGVEPETITYIEAHGTATELGDPIEIAALTEAFRGNLPLAAAPQPWCAIGSVKTNIGHADAAAGVAGLIKTVLALQHRQLPPSLHFEAPNPNIDFANSPFYVNATLNAWPASATPRRAGVSSFGIGGTNAHVVLEEAPMPPATSPSRPWQLLVLSAKTSSALDTTTTHLADHLEQHPEVDLADVAYTLHVGRQAHPHRRMLVCEGRDAAISALRHPQSLATARHEPGQPPVVFMFPGQGTPYVNMAKDLYEHEPTFRHHLDTAATLLQFHLGIDVRHVLYPEPEHLQAASAKLEQTAMAQPALFLVAYALAQLWQSWGVRPQAMIGHSLGEYVAACLAGVLSLEDALRVVVRRGQLMQSLPPGAMLAVQMSEADLRPRLAGEPSLSLAAVNGPSQCVVSGPEAAIARLQHVLEAQGMGSQRLSTSHAFHSAMMEPIVEAFTALVASVTFRAPQVPYISNVSGDWIEAQEATDPSYWARHLRQAVRFGVGLERLCGWESGQVWLEVGPGRTLSALSRGVARQGGHVVLRSMRHVSETHADAAFLLETLGQLWLSGVGVEWPGFYTHERRQRRPLPTYPFERQRYWIEAPKGDSAAQDAGASVEENAPKQDLADWFYIPSWKRTSLPMPYQGNSSPSCWLIFVDACGLGDQLAKRLQEAGHDVLTVRAGSGLTRLSERTYTMSPMLKEEYEVLLQDMLAQGKTPQHIVHLWGVTSVSPDLDIASVEPSQFLGFYSLIFLVQALALTTDDIDITVMTSNMQSITGDEILNLEKSTILGPVQVIPQEHSNIRCSSIDLTLEQNGLEKSLIDLLLAELDNPSRSGHLLAYRGKTRWERIFEPMRLEPSLQPPVRLRQGGVYLITGGLGGIGLTLAEYLAPFQTKLVLLGRAALPERHAWETWLSAHPKDDRVSQKILKIQALEALGAEVLPIRADGANEADMQAAVAHSLARFGHIHGVIHAAGVPGDGIILQKTPEKAAEVLAPKVRGTLVLEAVLKPIETDFVVLCSSLGSVLGGFGQVDYTAANAFLDAFAHQARDHFTVSINWDAWQEVGMAAEAAKPSDDTAETSSPVTRAATHPLLDYCRLGDSAQILYVSHLNPSHHWVLDEHRIGGQATLPGTVYLDIVKAVFADETSYDKVEMQDVYLLLPLTVNQDEEREVHTILKKQGEAFTFSVLSRDDSDTDAWVEHATGTIAQEAGPLPHYDLEEIKRRCPRETTIVTPAEQPDAYFIAFGPRWNISGQISWGEHEGLAFLELPEAYAADLTAYPLHPALLDMATGFLLTEEEGAFLPFSYERLRIQAPLPRRLYSHCRYSDPTQPKKEILSFDITLFDEQGHVLVDIQAYTVRRVAEDHGKETVEMALSAGAKPHTAYAPPTSNPSANQASARIQAEINQFGMMPSEGIEVFSRILATAESQVLVSTRHLTARQQEFSTSYLMSQLDQLTDVQQTYERSELSTPYLAPRNETEQILADIYQHLLGIAPVGVDDDFFELGGHSLLGTQLVSRVREAFQLTLPLQRLFEEPTVAGLAQYLAASQHVAHGQPLPVKEQAAELEEGIL